VRPAALEPWIVAWWTVFVVASVLDPLPQRLHTEALAEVSLGRATIVLVGGQLAEIAAAVLGIVVVRAIGLRQEALFGLRDEP
jgi:hypothetical protein